MAVGGSWIADGILDRTVTPDGHELALHHRNGVFTVRIDGHELISSRGRGSEEALAELGCRWLGDTARPQVLVGGLGIGYTLRAALDRLPRRAEVTVVELFTHVVRWNRGLLGALVGYPLDDPRVTVAIGDVHAVVAIERDRFHAILLDVDNGPDTPVVDCNRRLYDVQGLERLRSALAPSGMLAVWSAGDVPDFVDRLRAGGFTVESVVIPVAGAISHELYLARRTD
jgi:spermidine synthase